MSESDKVKPGPVPGWLKKLDRKFLVSLKRLQLPSGPWIVAVSGGPDSMALAHLFLRHHDQMLIMAHFDHELRGTESRGDAVFVENWTRKQQNSAGSKPELVVGKPEQPLAHLGGNLEANARKARYSWLAQMAKNHHSPCVFTAHHADDQAETLLFRLMRGTGIRGLAGIPPKRRLSQGVLLVRPLLEISKTTLMRYLDHFKVAYRTDSTNLKGDFARNQIRQKIIPALCEVMGEGTIDRIASFAWHARNLDQATNRAFQRWKLLFLRHASTKEMVIHLRGFQARAPYWIAQFLSELWKENGWPLLAMTREHWLNLVDHAKNGPIQMDLPGGILSRRNPKGGLLHLNKKTTENGD